jgi:ribosomal protein S27E
MCKNTECGFSAKAEAASLKCIYRIFGYNDEKMQHEDISQYAIFCPDCSGEAVYDHNIDIVYCYTCGGGWTNKQFRECESCGEIKLRDEMTDEICQDCLDLEDDEDE